jgi:hypothetical protein
METRRYGYEVQMPSATKRELSITQCPSFCLSYLLITIIDIALDKQVLVKFFIRNFLQFINASEVYLNSTMNAKTLLEVRMHLYILFH